MRSAAWHAALIEGASTYVPFSASPGYVDVDGEPFVVQTVSPPSSSTYRVCRGVLGGAVKHSDAGGKVANGVEYRQVSGELSAQVVGLLFRLSVPGRAARARRGRYRFRRGSQHPRRPLPGAHFVLRYPARGFRPVGSSLTRLPPTAGTSFPRPPPRSQVAVFDGLDGAARPGVRVVHRVARRVHSAGDIDGERVVDSNPESATGFVLEIRRENSDSYLRPYPLDDAGLEVAYPDPALDLDPGETGGSRRMSAIRPG